MKRLYNIRNHELCIWSWFWEIGDQTEKTVKSRILLKKTHEADFFRNCFWRKCSLGPCAIFSENMVSVSVLGFEKFASQVWKIGTCHEICEKKTSPYGHLAKLVPQLPESFHHKVSNRQHLDTWKYFACSRCQNYFKCGMFISTIYLETPPCFSIWYSPSSPSARIVPAFCEVPVIKFPRWSSVNTSWPLNRSLTRLVSVIRSSEQLDWPLWVSYSDSAVSNRIPCHLPVNKVLTVAASCNDSSNIQYFWC